MDSGGKEARVSSAMQGSRQAITFRSGTPSLLASMLCSPMNTSAAVIRACPAPYQSLAVTAATHVGQMIVSLSAVHGDRQSLQ